MNAVRQGWRRVLAGVLVVLTGVVVAAAAGVAATLGTAALITTPGVFLVAGLAVFTAVVFGTAVAGFRILRAAHPLAGATVTAAAVTVLTLAVASMTVLQPFPMQSAGPAPAKVQFWELSTGTRTAFVHAPAAPGSPHRSAPVIFLHGGPGTPGEGIPTGGAELAADGFEVYAYDQLGAGRSTRLADVTGYTVERQVTDLEAIRRTIGAEQLILVGQSWGGSLAAQYLAAHPDRVAKAVFVAPGAIWGGGYAEGDVGEPWKDMTPEQQSRYDELTGSPRILVQALLMAVNANAAHALVPDAEADSWMHAVALTGRDTTSCTHAIAAPPHDNPQGFYVNQLTIADFDKIPDPRPQLRTVEVPSLVMAPQCDFIRWAVTREYRDVLPRSTLVDVPNAGHAISYDQPDAFVRLLRAFVLDKPLPLPAYTAPEPPPGRWTR
ncbi:alpha/beta fold hydrolase [Mycolicibacterium komossense]|uniref:Alpha/beta fold hydrolase n=1 Tax=Mycolicibacterium komossense TaxID=1779 RepID=A0ABT3CFB6_9MYCO|nr:alpha/beta fold hydrolase [Mycolicibacterium komossense]MCV7228180.1 alpha/beta fold hydrolase [Mycolicibacterium komossense]